MRSRWSGVVLGFGLLVGLFGVVGTAVAASPRSGPPPGWSPAGYVPVPAWQPVAFTPPRPAWTLPAAYGMADYRWRPLADARAAALRRFGASGLAARAPAYFPAARPPMAPVWRVAPDGAMAPPALTSGRPAPPRYAAHPAGAWRGSGGPDIVTFGGQPYRFRPLPPSRPQVAAFAPPLWGSVAAPARAPVAWAPVPSAVRYAQPAVRPAPGRAGWVVYQFRPDTRFPRGETLQVPAGARLSHASTGPEWRAGETSPQAGQEWRSGHVYN